MVGMSKKDRALLAAPFAVTMTSRNPTGNVVGRLTTILVSLHEVTVTLVPPNETVPVWLPKLLPLIVTGPPAGGTGPTVGERLVMIGVDWARAVMGKSEMIIIHRAVQRPPMSSPLPNATLAA